MTKLKRLGIFSGLVICLFAYQNCANHKFDSPESAAPSSTEGESTSVEDPAKEDPKVPEICDPLNPNRADNCDNYMWRGKIAYLPENKRALPGESIANQDEVDDIFKHGNYVPATILLTQVHAPPQSWDAGFKLADGDLIKDEKGQKLMEYFAMDLSGGIKLGPEDTEGDYWFALLSDDGAVLNVEENGEMKTLVNNDGTHSPQMRCAGHAIAMTKSSRIDAQIKYFQGPRTEIALVVLMAKAAPNSPPPCNTAGNDETLKVGETTGAWKVLSPENYTRSSK